MCGPANTGSYLLFFIAGVTHVGGDMFKSIPHADAIFMKVSHSMILSSSYTILIKYSQKLCGFFISYKM